MKITQAVPAMFAALTMKTMITSTSRPRCRGLCSLLLCIAALWIMPTGARAQTPITVVGPALRRVDIYSNNLGIVSGDRIAISADSVTPNGANGTNATAQTTNLLTGQPEPSPTPLGIPWNPTTVSPNEFRKDIPYDPNLIGQWTMTFTNNAATTTQARTPTLVGVNGLPYAAAPYAYSVIISGSTLNPTFTWSFPTNVDGITFEVLDVDVTTITGIPDTVFTQSFSGATGSHTLGYTLTLGTHWAVGIRGLILRNLTPPLMLTIPNTAAYSEKYFNFDNTSVGTLPQIYLPSIDSNGVYNFNLTVQPNTTYYIDPTVATGFIYTIGAGDPNFATVVLPALQGAAPYTITWDNGLHTEQRLGGEILTFPDAGVSTFTVRGIDPADGLDPTSGTEFVTGLTFAGIGSFTGTMTPLATIYIVNEGSHTVSVIDPSTNTVVDTVRVGFGPVQAVLAPKGTIAYVLNSGAGTVSVLNTTTNSVTATLRVGWLPGHEAVTPDGSSVYVTNTGSNSVSVISTATQSVVATIPVGLAPVGVAITPDGKRAYVANAASENVSVIDTASNTVSAVVQVGAIPLTVALNGSSAYVVNSGANSVSVINTSTNTVEATVQVGYGPVDVAIAPNGATAYVADEFAHSVTVLNTATNQVVTTLPVGFLPVKTAINPNGTTAYVADAGGKSVSVINTANNTVVATIGVGADPVDVSISPDGVHAYVTNAGSNSVSVIDTSTNAVSATVPVGVLPVNGAIF